MKKQTLAQSNPHLRQHANTERIRIRSIASSTAIETGEAINIIEQKIIQLRSAPHHVTLA